MAASGAEARAQPIPGGATENYRRCEIETRQGPAKFWGEVDGKEQPHGFGTALWEDGTNYHGGYEDGEMHGVGQYVFGNGDSCSIGFERGRPCGKGLLVEKLAGGDSVEYDVEYDGRLTFADGARSVIKTRRKKKTYKECMVPVCAFLAGPEEGPCTYDHCVSVRGKLVWARPPRGDCSLFNANEVRGNIVIMLRGGVQFSRKVWAAQEAGAVGLVCIGANIKEEKYSRPIPRVSTGPLPPSEDLPPNLPPLSVKMPVVYALHRLRVMLQEGGDATIHFDSKSPPGCQSGAVFIQGEAAKLRNAEGEAEAQWSEADLSFDKGERTMVGSDGTLIPLTDKASPPRTLQCKMAGTQRKAMRECHVALLGHKHVTLYGFRLTFGDTEWSIFKRFSEFDALDKRLNALYGLPPAGLPPKKWFGLEEESLVRNRHQMLTAYLADCIKRPVLTLAHDLQEFCKMPAAVALALRKGG